MVRQTPSLFCHFFLFFWVFLASTFISTIPLRAADFDVTTIAVTSDITVMEVTGNYDAKLTDGSGNDLPREEIAKNFFTSHPDKYDFLVIFSNFDFQMPQQDVLAFYTTVKNDVRGIGLNVFDYSSSYGSNGKLQGTIDFGNLFGKSSNPLSPEFSETMEILSHELLHRWAAEVRFKNSNGDLRNDLIGKDGTHWSFLLDTDGSVEYGNQWLDNGDGTFTSLPGRKYYSQLDLYLMGLADKSEVPPMLLIQNPEIDKNRVSEAGVTITGNPQYVTIDDIIAAEGERIPNSENSQKSFKIGCIYITRPGTYNKDDLYAIRQIINNWQIWYSSLTRGRSSIALDSPSTVDIPSNSGLDAPPFTARTVPPEINDGIAWLHTKQEADGSWHDSDGTVTRDTATVLGALKYFPDAAQEYDSGLQYLSDSGQNNSDFLARKMDTLSSGGKDVTALQGDLFKLQNQDGGWGNSNNYESNPADTALALKAFADSGWTNQTTIDKAVSYLKTAQNSDGGWGGNGQGSEIQATVNVLSSLAPYVDSYSLGDNIDAGVLWLRSKQNTDGGFGNSPSTIYDTANAILALRKFNAADEVLTPALNYILDLQSENGSWHDSPYQTSLAVQAVWESKRQTDLSVTTADIKASQTTFASLPTEISLSASINNLGLTAARDVKVALYDNIVAETNKVDEQTVSVDGGSSAPVSFTAFINDGQIHRYFVVVDPDNEIQEASESNNKAIIAIYPEPTYDFEISPDDVVVSGTEFDMFQEVNITVNVKNRGTREAEEVPLSLYLETADGPHNIGIKKLTIPAGQSSSTTFTWHADVAGTNLALTAEVDPANNFTELSEENNKVQRSITINPSTKPNLEVRSGDIHFSPNPAQEAGAAEISAIIKNNGFGTASDLTVDFYLGVPGAGGKLLGQNIIASLEVGSELTTVFDWTDIPVSGDQVITVVADPANQIDEADENDNSGFISVDVLSLPDLEVNSGSMNLNPTVPRKGEPIAATVTVVNSGEQEALNVPVTLFADGAELETKSIEKIDGNSQASVSFNIDTTTMTGTMTLKVVVDPDNEILEGDETNNEASRTTAIQDADLWLSERYISPNGDGVQDETSFTFRLQSPMNVEVVIVDETKKIIRTFQGTELQVTTGGTIPWDGRNDQGKIVADGDYNIQVRQGDTILSSLVVTVDNNLSSIAEALGTKYLYSASIDFEKILGAYIPGAWIGYPNPRPSIYEWIPEGKGIVWILNKNDVRHEAPLYPIGIYISNMEGSYFDRVVPNDWIDNDNYTYSYHSESFSKDGSLYLFSVYKCNNYESQCPCQLYLANTITHKTTLVYESNSYKVGPDAVNELNTAISPDNSIMYFEMNGPKIARINNSSVQLMNANEYVGSYPQWSSSGDKITGEIKDKYGRYKNGVRVLSIEGGHVYKHDIDGYYNISSSQTKWDGAGGLIFQDFTNVYRIDCKNYNVAPITGEDVGFDTAGNGVVITQGLNVNECKSGQTCNAIAKDTYPKRGWFYFDSHLSPDGKFFSLNNQYSYDNYDYLAVLDINGENINYFPAQANVDSGWCSSNDSDLGLGFKSKWPYLLDLCGKGDTHYFYIMSSGWLYPHWLVVNDRVYYENNSGWKNIYHYVLLDVHTGELKNFPVDIGYPIQHGTQYFSIDNTIWGSRLNLTTDLLPLQNDLSVVIKGTAIDKNFSYYKLEYASEDNPDEWHPIKPPSEEVVVNDVLTNWVPPQSGRYLIRLTAYDKAGNISVKRRRIAWNLQNPVVNLYKENEYFSPNNDGVQDTGILHYTTLEPISLTFNIYNHDDHLVKTILADHPLPGDQKFSWDGTDSQGQVVADGVYRINFNQYNYYFEVDNSPPSASLELTDPKLDSPSDPRVLSNLLALAQDKNISSWKLEYSALGNSADWFEYGSGENTLARIDNERNIILDESGNPVPVTLKVYFNEDLIFLAGKVFRLTVKDAAGNQSVSEAIFHDELFLINAWDSRQIKFTQNDDGSFKSDPDDILTADLLNQQNEHVIYLINTNQAKFVSVTLQYRKGMQWKDGPVLLPDPSDPQRYRWDAPSIDVKDIVAIRLVAKDELDRLLISNEIKFNNIVYNLDACTSSITTESQITGTVNLYENLNSLSFQIISENDPSYQLWTDVKTYYNTNISNNLIWTFNFNDVFDTRYSYQVRMLGKTDNNQDLISNIIDYPFPSCGGVSNGGNQGPFQTQQYNDIDLNIDYKQADCNNISNEVRIYLDGTLLNPPSKINYYIGISGEYKLLKTFDYATQGLGQILLDPTAYPEGSYPIRVTFDASQTPVIPEQNLQIDHSRPTASISYPLSGTSICPKIIVNENGTCFNIDVEGVADDNTQVANYSLLYAFPDENGSDLYQAETYPDCIQGQSAPIVGASSKSGNLGTWTQSESLAKKHSLYLQVVDSVGNKTCVKQEDISIDTSIDVALKSDLSTFSPNGDSFEDQADIVYTINEYSKVDLTVYGPFADDNISDADLNQVKLFRTIASGSVHLGGSAQVVWDGKDDNEQVGSDGWYRILISATDICGNTSRKFVDIVIDNTPPQTLISYPVVDESINALSFEIRGTADDKNFESYRLEAVNLATPDQTILLAKGGHPVIQGQLGGWNTYGLTGEWQLRLTTRDSVGNENESVAHISLLPKVDLISSLTITPQSFSPNGDGIADLATVDIDLTDLCNVSAKVVDEHGDSVKVLDDLLSVTDSQHLTWNGIDSNDAVVADGSYKLVIKASLADNSAVFQEETVTVNVDNTLPEIKISSPPDQSFLSDANISVFGDITDNNLDEYRIDLSHGGTTNLLDSGTQSRLNHTFSILDNLEDGLYTLDATAVDTSGNKKEEIVQFTLDRAPPEISILEPLPDAVFAAGQNVISIKGSIKEQNFSSLQIKYAAGENPTQWTELFTTQQLPESPVWYEWNTDNYPNLVDGLYSLIFTVTDQAGNKAEQTLRITIDRNPPNIAISSPVQSAYIHEQVDVIGSVTDTLLKNYTLYLAAGGCDIGPLRWSQIAFSDQPIENGKLSTLPLAPTDGAYCVKLTASDQAGNTSSLLRDITVDTQPPIPPVLDGEYTAETGTVLTWPKIPESDIAGCDIYRNGVKIASTTPDVLTFTDPNLVDGSYSYRLKAFDLAGNESDFSNEITILVDTTGPSAWISSPFDEETVNDLVDIKGTAFSNDFKEYRILIGQGLEPANWILVRRSPLPSQSQILAQLDTLSYQDGSYTLKLEAEDVNGNVNSDSIVITIDNSPPAPPTLSSVSQSGSEVSLAWLANKESDLAGYLLFRNNNLANASELVVGSMTPYLVDGTTYENLDVPDGHYEYYLLAVDKAGNLSAPSNSLYVDLDTHAPHALITSPASGYAFEESVSLEAESPDIDIKQVQFEYKAATEGSWHALGSPIFQRPFTVPFEPGQLGLPYGNYQIRAVATDESGKTDPTPSYIPITYTDLTPPAAPGGLSAKVDGGRVLLNWTANTETDLAGYNVYYAALSVPVNTVPLTTTSYVYPPAGDSELANGVRNFSVTAIDIYGNESEKSQVSSTIFTPTLNAPVETPTPNNVQNISGLTLPGCSVSIFRTNDGVETQVGSIAATDSGDFTVEVDLLPGENLITAKATDSSGNISKISNQISIRYVEPLAAPAGLQATVDKHVVDLSWDPNQESNLSGYQVYRDGVKLPSSLPDLSLAIASGSDQVSDPAFAYDGIDSTYSQMNVGGSYPPCWWQLDFQEKVYVKQITINWYADLFSIFGIGPSYVAKDYEVQAWDGSSWITVKSYTDNNLGNNQVDLPTPYLTDKLRLYITSANSGTTMVGLADVSISQVSNAIPSYVDTNVSDGIHQYQVSAYDTLNFESDLSAPLSVAVGDVVAPKPPTNLSYTVNGSTVRLSWTPNDEVDLAGYHVYRSTDQLSWGLINAGPVTEPAYDDVDLLNGQYSYRVSAIDQVGNESGYSNVVEATIAKSLPVPQNLTVIALPVGQSLKACWDSLPETDGYFIYRSESAGGPYTRVNNYAVAGNCFTDVALVNGTHYYYVVTSTDSIGNESDYSNEADGIPVDEVSPDKPVLISPTIAGIPTVVTDNKVTIGGFGEPGADVDLYCNSHFYASVQSTAEENTRNVSIGSVFVPSPEGKYFAYNYNNIEFLIYYSANSGYAGGLSQADASSFAWSYDSKLLADVATDASNGKAIYIYDLSSRAFTRLTEDTSVSESSPSWSQDGRIAFISNRSGSNQVWLKDIANGQLTQVTYSAAPELIKFAPDGQKILYVESGSLYVIDLTTGDTILVDDHLADDGTGQTIDWEPDSRRIAYVSDGAGNTDVYVYDLSTGDKNQVTDTEENIVSLSWSADGQRILFVPEELNGGSIQSCSTVDNTCELLKSENVTIDNLQVTSSGTIFYSDSANHMHRLVPAGFFSFADVPLHSGENIFYAIARDSSGNVSPESDPISVSIDPSILPDVVAEAQDIVLVPATPFVGDQVSFQFSIRNQSEVTANDVPYDVYVLDPANNLEQVGQGNIPVLPAHGEEVYSVTWDSTGKEGVNTVYVVVDGEDVIQEANEENNIAEKPFHVVSSVGIELSTRINGSQFHSDEYLAIDGELFNSGPDNTYSLDVTVEDLSGTVVDVVDSSEVNLPFGQPYDFSYVWNSGSVYAGNYQVRTVVKSGQEVLAEKVLPFTILPDIELTASVDTDKLHYGANEEVHFISRITNSGKNFIIPSLTARLTVSSADGEVYSKERQVTNLLNGDSVSLTATWPTADNPPGEYSARIELLYDGEVVGQDVKSFTIDPVLVLTGDLGLATKVVPMGSPVGLSYTINSSGNIGGTGLTFNVTILDSDTLAVIERKDLVIDMAANDSVSGSFAVAAADLYPGHFKALLFHDTPEESYYLGADNFTVADTIPPVVELVSPLSGSVLNDSPRLSVKATDNYAGVDAVDYQIDGNSWIQLPLVDPSTATYFGVWQVTESDEGAHLITFRASDRNGNYSAPVTTEITLEPETDLAATYSAEQYRLNEDLKGELTITNHGWAKTLQLQSWIEGPDAAVVYTFASQTLKLGSDEVRKVSLDWNVGTTTAGVYTIHNRLARGDTIIAEQVSSFEILPAVVLTSTLGSDRQDYGINDDVLLHLEVDSGGNYTIPATTVVIEVKDASGNLTSSETRSIENFAPGTSRALDFVWNTAQHRAGDYSITANVLVDDHLESTETIPIRIDPVLTMTGSLTLNPEAAPQGDALSVDFEVVNTGNILAQAVPLRLEVLNGDGMPVITRDHSVDLDINGNFSGKESIDTAALGIGTYRLVMEYDWQDTSTRIAEAIFEIFDHTPPKMQVLSPEDGVLFDGPFDLSVIATDDGSGVASVAYRLNSGAWQPLSLSDPTAGLYSYTWSPVEADEGIYSVEFRAVDEAGNETISPPRSMTIELCKPFDELTGKLSYQPQPLYYGQEMSLQYELTNQCSKDITGLSVTMNIEDPATSAVVKSEATTLNIAANGQGQKSVTLPTLEELTPANYRAVLEVAVAGRAPRELSNLEFEVRHALQVSAEKIDRSVVLVWENYQCEPQCEDSGVGPQVDAVNTPDQSHCRQDESCIRENLLERILKEATDSYRIVHERQEFEDELRNPLYTDILILGDQFQITDHLSAELREKINSGSGLITSGWLFHEPNGTDKDGHDPNVLGVKREGSYNGDLFRVKTVDSPITSLGEFSFETDGWKIEAASDAVVAGWFVEENGGNDLSPAIVLHDYGLGKTVYLAFDYGRNLRDATFTQMSELLEASLQNIHHVDTDQTLLPYLPAPVNILVENPGRDFDLLFKATYPPDLWLYDPAAMSWHQDGHWETNLSLPPGSAGYLPFYLLAPDKPGTYDLSLQSFMTENDREYFLQSDTLTFDVPAGRDELLAGLTADLESLNLTGGDRAKADSAVSYLEQARGRTVSCDQSIEKNMLDLEKAVEDLIGIPGIDITTFRQEFDTLLRIEESRWYFYNGPNCDGNLGDGN